MTSNYNKIIITVALLCYQSLAMAQAPLITTIAGSVSGYSGDGGTATAAKLAYPAAVAIGDSGKLYIADKQNNCIRRISPTGIITTIAGVPTGGYGGDGGPATTARMNAPTGVAVDAAKNIYIADQGNNCIRRVSATGIITTIAGTGTPGYSGDGGPATAAMLSTPVALAVDGGGNVFVADQTNNRIRKISTTGIITTVAGSGSMSGFSGDGFAATAALLSGPAGIAVTGSGALYIVDQMNNRIRMVNPAGVISTVVGSGVSGYTGDGGNALTARLSFPAGVVATDSGYIYIAEGNNNAIRKVDLSGIITTIAGDGSSGFAGDGGAATASRLSAPNSLAVDASGKVYVADAGNNRIRKIAKKPVISGITTPLFVTAPALFPNPNTGSFTLSGMIAGNSQYIEATIVNATGAVVYHTTLPTNNGFIKATITPDSPLPNGVYVLQLYTSTQTDAIRFVVQQ